MNDAEDTDVSDTDVTDVPFLPGEYPLAGRAMKGPFLAGTTVTIYELDGQFVQTGRSYSATTTADDGGWSVPGVQLASPFVEVLVSGFFHDEFTGSPSVAPLTLRVLHDVRVGQELAVHLAAAIERERIVGLIRGGLTFDAAAVQAHRELMTALGLPDLGVPAYATRPDGRTVADAQVLAMSLLLWASADASVGALAANTQALATDLAGDGRLEVATLSGAITYDASSLLSGSGASACAAADELTVFLGGQGSPLAVDAPLEALGQIYATCPGGHLDCVGNCTPGYPDATSFAWSGDTPRCNYACLEYPDVLAACSMPPQPLQSLAVLCEADETPSLLSRMLGEDGTTCDGALSCPDCVTTLERQRHFLQASIPCLDYLFDGTFPLTENLHPADDPAFWMTFRAAFDPLFGGQGDRAAVAWVAQRDDLDGAGDLCVSNVSVGDGNCNVLAIDFEGSYDGGDCLPAGRHNPPPLECPIE